MAQVDPQFVTSDLRLAWLEAILASAVDAIVTIDERSTIHSFNPAAERVFGYNQSEVIGKRVDMLMPEPYRSEYESYLTAFFSTGRKKAIGTRRRVSGRRKDGAEFPLELSVAEIHSAQGRFFTAILHDISERERVEEQLRRSEQRFRTMFESAGIAMALDDGDGRLLETNPAFQRMFGYTAEELQGKSFLELTHPDDVACSRKLFEELVAGKRDSFQLEKRYLRKDGAVLSGLVALSAVRDSAGRFRHTVAMIEDISERTRAEVKLRRREAELAHATRLSAVGELASGIAHELNQPLATIINYAESARLRLGQDPGSSSEETGVRLEKIAAEAKRAGEIIHRMRHLLRNKEPQWSVVDLNECATVIADLIKSEARLKGVSVRVRLADDNPAVSGDGIQIQQVILNLVRNGMDSIAERPADGDTLTIATELVDNGLVRCSVGDSGVGLSDDNRDRLFKPFYTTKSAGLGLGLSVSRWIIEAHGGQISAAHRPGGGAVFSFVLPLVQEDDHGKR